MKKSFRIVDGQGQFHQGEIFSSEKEAWENLASYHNVDWSGEDENGNFIDLYDYLDLNYQTHKEKLDFMLEHGQWEIEEAEGFKCPLCGKFAEYKKHYETHIWSCQECPFIAYEYYDAQNTASLINYLADKEAKEII